MWTVRAYATPSTGGCTHSVLLACLPAVHHRTEPELPGDSRRLLPLSIDLPLRAGVLSTPGKGTRRCQVDFPSEPSWLAAILAATFLQPTLHLSPLLRRNPMCYRFRAKTGENQLGKPLPSERTSVDPELRRVTLPRRSAMSLRKCLHDRSKNRFPPSFRTVLFT